MILNLPTELALHTLLFVDLQTIHSLQLVCKPWAEFIQVNESTVYHNVAASQNLIPSPSTLLEDLPRWYSLRSLEGVANWKAFCRRRVDIRRSWQGRAPAKSASYTATGTRVHRIKVDELHGYVITTSADGGLQVTDIAEDEVLWALPKTHVRGWAHVEYADGFIIFDRRDGHKEIWRRASDAQDSADRVVEESAPDERQLVASKDAAEQYRSTSNRGHFIAWALISPGGITTAFRAVYPVLLTASDHHAFVFDVRTGARLHKITNPQAPTDLDLGHLNYVEISDRHVFTCDSNVLRVYARADGRCVFEIYSNKEHYGRWLFAISRTPPQEQVEGALVVHPVHAFERRAPGTSLLLEEFYAAHVSKCGRHLVGALSTARIVVIYNFERVLSGEAQLFDLAFEVQLGSGRTNTQYLAFEKGRICVATRRIQGRGIFVVHVLGPPSDSTARPRIIITRVPWYNDPQRLNAISCMQMSDTGIWFNWQERPEEDDPETLKAHDIEFYATAEDSAYRTRLPGGHVMVLAANEFGPTEHILSTVHSVNFGIPS